MTRRWLSKMLSALFILLLFVAAFAFSNYISGNQQALDFVVALGYPGIVTLAIISGLNLIVPFPAPVSVPIFIAAGFSVPVIISGYVIGTTIADLAAFYLGTLGKTYVARSNHKIVQYLIDCCTHKKKNAALAIFIYATVVPLPNELLLTPLGALGYRLRDLFIPFVAGTLLHMTLLTYGIVYLSELLA